MTTPYESHHMAVKRRPWQTYNRAHTHTQCNRKFSLCLLFTIGLRNGLCTRFSGCLKPQDGSALWSSLALKIDFRCCFSLKKQNGGSLSSHAYLWLFPAWTESRSTSSISGTSRTVHRGIIFDDLVAVILGCNRFGQRSPGSKEVEKGITGLQPCLTLELPRVSQE